MTLGDMTGVSKIRHARWIQSELCTVASVIRTRLQQIKFREEEMMRTSRKRCFFTEQLVKFCTVATELRMPKFYMVAKSSSWFLQRKNTSVVLRCNVSMFMSRSHLITNRWRLGGFSGKILLYTCLVLVFFPTSCYPKLITEQERCLTWPILAKFFHYFLLPKEI